MSTRRSSKVNAMVQGELSRLFLQDVSDPNLQNLVVTEVDLSPDLRTAKVYYSKGMMNQATPVKEFNKSIEKVSPFLKRKLGQNLVMRHVPELSFIEDHHTENVTRLMHVFHELETH